MPKTLIAGLVCFLVAAGCVGGQDEPETRRAVASIEEGSAEALGVLGFLNGPEATFELLDEDIGLDSRAARSIVDHVSGPDGDRGTSDDDPLDSIEELDALYWVGESAIDSILEYVISIGGVTDVVVEGVLLSSDEAATITRVANGATLEELDDVARLDARAARGLVDGRPFADVHAVAAVPWVGPSALGKLLDFAATWAPTPTVDDVARDILAEQGITGIRTALSDEEVETQLDLYPTEVSFERAFHAAVDSWLSDRSGVDAPLEVARDAGPYGPCMEPEHFDRLVCFANQPSSWLSLVAHDAVTGEDGAYLPERGERPDESWVFVMLLPSLTDTIFWAVVDRRVDSTGDVSVYNYGFN